MAGEFEEPFSLSFRSDSLHSGSISFGRFEAESLSWEKRSSFSHNRYLEEVEKYSKPGSVIEKKAYFEAHFKKKALLRQSSSECQNATEYQSSENGFSEHAGYKEEIEHVNEGCHFAHFNESPDGSKYDEEYVVMEFGSKDKGVSGSEPLVEPALSNAGGVVDGVKHVKAAETLQTDTGNLLLVNAESGKEVKENLNDEAVNVVVISKPICPSPDGHTVGEVDSVTPENQQDPSAKARSASETKLTKRRLKPQVNVTQVQRNVSGEAHGNSAVKSSGRKVEGSPRTKTEKQSSHTAAPATRLVHRISNPEDHECSKGEVNHQDKSEKDLRVKKPVQPHHSASEKVFPRTHQTENRPKQTLSSSRPGLKKSAAVFNFKSDERAERRKEFYMMLEEKMHAKQAEMNQIQAKTLEKTVAETIQFQRNNFKATPMPSFYHEAIKRGPNSKAASSTSKSMKLQSKWSSPGERDTARSPHPKAGNDQAVSGNGSTNTAHPPHLSVVINCHSVRPSETGAISQLASTNKSHLPQTEMNCEATQKKKQENDYNFQKHRVPDDSKAMKAQKTERKQKLEAGRRSSEVARKGMRSIHTQSGSGIVGHLALGVMRSIHTQSGSGIVGHLALGVPS